jgi:hypothetical protein
MDGQLELVEWIHRVIGSEDAAEEEDAKEPVEAMLTPVSAAVSVDS